jgi:hypothetical protein
MLRGLRVVLLDVLLLDHLAYLDQGRAVEVVSQFGGDRADGEEPGGLGRAVGEEVLLDMALRMQSLMRTRARSSMIWFGQRLV